MLGTSFSPKICFFLKRVFFKYVIKGTKIRRWDDLNQKYNKMDGAWIIIMLISSIAFMFGATLLLQYVLFPNSQNNLLSLMIAYLIVKVGIVIYARKKL